MSRRSAYNINLWRPLAGWLTTPTITPKRLDLNCEFSGVLFGSQSHFWHECNRPNTGQNLFILLPRVLHSFYYFTVSLSHATMQIVSPFIFHIMHYLFAMLPSSLVHTILVFLQYVLYPVLQWYTVKNQETHLMKWLSSKLQDYDFLNM